MNIVECQDDEKSSKENEINNLTEINDEIDNETRNGCEANIILENPTLIADERSENSSRINDSSNKINKTGNEEAQKMYINRYSSSKDNKEPQKGLSTNKKLNEPSKIMSDSSNAKIQDVMPKDPNHENNASQVVHPSSHMKICNVRTIQTECWESTKDVVVPSSLATPPRQKRSRSKEETPIKVKFSKLNDAQSQMGSNRYACKLPDFMKTLQCLQMSKF